MRILRAASLLLALVFLAACDLLEGSSIMSGRKVRPPDEVIAAVVGYHAQSSSGRVSNAQVFVPGEDRSVPVADLVDKCATLQLPGAEPVEVSSRTEISRAISDWTDENPHNIPYRPAKIKETEWYWDWHDDHRVEVLRVKFTRESNMLKVVTPQGQEPGDCRATLSTGLSVEPLEYHFIWADNGNHWAASPVSGAFSQRTYTLPKRAPYTAMEPRFADVDP